MQTACLKIALLSIALLLSWPTKSQAQQDMHQLYQAVEEYLLQQLQQYDTLPLENIKINVRPLPDRLTLDACQAPLEFHTGLNDRLTARTTVNVQCQQPAWRLFISAEIYAETWVVVATQPILRDDLITEDAVSLVLRPINQIRQQHLHQLDQVISYRAKRAISPNTLLSVQMLDPPFLVINNHKVTIITQIGGLEIRTPGVALSNGLAQEQIQVRNLRSDRTIHAIVIAPNTVMVP
jgi:flagella basal body P-ring formation protein FlgA